MKLRCMAAALAAAALVGGCGGRRRASRAGAAKTATSRSRSASRWCSPRSTTRSTSRRRRASRREAEQTPGVDLSLSAGRQRTSSDEVIGLIEDAIAKDVDAIAVNGSDDKPLIPVLQRVIDAGIPLVLFDAPADELEGKYATYIGTDNEAGGRAAGEWLAGKLPDGGDVGVVVCVAGPSGHPRAREGLQAGLGVRLRRSSPRPTRTATASRAAR